MLKNYIKIAWRNVVKNSLQSSINIIGLAVGLASFIVILVYLNYELSYDKWDDSLKKVYKVSFQQKEDILETTPAPLGGLLAKSHPDVEAATTIQPSDDYECLLTAGDKKIYQKGVVTLEDISFFKVFPYQLSAGDIRTALNTPNAVILSEEVSEKLFGKADPMGKTIKIFNDQVGLVTGVLKNPAGPSHMTVKVLIRDVNAKSNNFWGNYSYLTYIKLKQPANNQKLDESLNRVYYLAWLKRNNKTFAQTKRAELKTILFTDPVGNLHNFPRHGESHFKITLTLLVLAVFLLIASAINFSNLSVVRAITRAKEVGIRKVLGSGKRSIIIQSLFEITIQCILSLLIGLFFVSRALPYFSNSFNVPLSFINNDTVSICLQIAASLLIIILVSGIYPALFLSNFQAADVLKGNYSTGGKGVFFRNSLLVVQLTLSALFITAIIIINRQMAFMQHKDLGFNASQVVRIEALQNTREDKFATVRNMLLTVPGVEYVSKSTSVAGSVSIDTSTSEYKFAGNKYRLNGVKISADYFKTMGITLLDGRFFEDSHPEDQNNTAIINETAFKKIGGKHAVGQTITFPYCDSIPYQIVGVVKDFNVQGMESRIVPTIYSISNAHCGYRSGGALLVKINTDHVKQSLAGITALWKTIEPDYPIRYSFLDQDFKNLYVAYDRLNTVVTFFSAISILIAVSGLFALTSFLAQLRVKEIGVRKVLGASVANITTMLSKDFVKLVILSIVVAVPVAFWAMSKWLNDFAYRINLHWWIFALAGLIIVLITLITVGLQSIWSAMANPVKSLRNE